MRERGAESANQEMVEHMKNKISKWKWLAKANSETLNCNNDLTRNNKMDDWPRRSSANDRLRLWWYVNTFLYGRMDTDLRDENESSKKWKHVQIEEDVYTRK
jgi:hypothetical protein